MKLLSSSAEMLGAFGLDGRSIVSLVGGGGKTTLMFQMARCLSEQGEKVITTTTTKIHPPSKEETPYLLVIGEKDRGQNDVASLVDNYGHITIVSDALPNGKMQGISKASVKRISDLVPDAHILVEADGAARRPLKAPRDNEPVIPEISNLVIAVAGMDGVGRPLDERAVFSVDRFASICGLSAGSPITPEAIGAVMVHPRGLLKGVPKGARVAAFLNKLDVEGAEEGAERIAAEIFARRDPRIDRVVLGSLKYHPRWLRVLRPNYFI